MGEAANLAEALDAGCDDLAACARNDRCPIPLLDIATPETTEDPR